MRSRCQVGELRVTHASSTSATDRPAARPAGATVNSAATPPPFHPHMTSTQEILRRWCDNARGSVAGGPKGGAHRPQRSEDSGRVPGGDRTRHRPSDRNCYSIRKPEIARLITNCWISDVPSKIVWLISGCPGLTAQGCDLRFLVRPVRRFRSFRPVVGMKVGMDL